MKRILVSLISEQTVPNVLVANHFKPDVYWFVTTKKMEKEKRTDSTIKALELRGHHLSSTNMVKFFVDQDSITHCIERFEEEVDSIGEEVNYCVNITGGNKVMALGAVEVFRNIGEKVIIGYMPLGKNEFIQVYPRKKPFKTFFLDTKLSLREYLACYGFTIRNLDDLTRTRKLALERKELSQWILSNYEKLRGFLGFMYTCLGQKRKEKKYFLSEVFDRHLSETERSFAKQLGIEIFDRRLQKQFNKDEIHYITGGWLDEYAYNVVAELVTLNIANDVLLNIQIQSMHGADSELDVAFMKDNSFYHIECKTLGDQEEQAIVRDEIYKKGAISTLLGKGTKRAIICTTLNSVKDNVKRRAEDYDLEVLSITETRNLKEKLMTGFGLA